MFYIFEMIDTNGLKDYTVRDFGRREDHSHAATMTARVLLSQLPLSEIHIYRVEKIELIESHQAARTLFDD